VDNAMKFDVTPYLPISRATLIVSAAMAAFAFSVAGSVLLG